MMGVVGKRISYNSLISRKNNVTICFVYRKKVK